MDRSDYWAGRYARSPAGLAAAHRRAERDQLRGQVEILATLGASPTEIARSTGVPRATVHRWLNSRHR